MSAGILSNLHWDNSEGRGKGISLSSKYINQVRCLGKCFGITVDKSIITTADPSSIDRLRFSKCTTVPSHELLAVLSGLLLRIY